MSLPAVLYDSPPPQKIRTSPDFPEPSAPLEEDVIMGGFETDYETILESTADEEDYVVVNTVEASIYDSSSSDNNSDESYDIRSSPTSHWTGIAKNVASRTRNQVKQTWLIAKDWWRGTSDLVYDQVVDPTMSQTRSWLASNTGSLRSSESFNGRMSVASTPLIVLGEPLVYNPLLMRLGEDEGGDLIVPGDSSGKPADVVHDPFSSLGEDFTFVSPEDCLDILGDVDSLSGPSHSPITLENSRRIAMGLAQAAKTGGVMLAESSVDWAGQISRGSVDAWKATRIRWQRLQQESRVVRQTFALAHLTYEWLVLHPYRQIEMQQHLKRLERQRMNVELHTTRHSDRRSPRRKESYDLQLTQ